MVSYKIKKDFILAEIDHKGYASKDETLGHFTTWFNLGYGVFAKTLQKMVAEGVVSKEATGKSDNGNWIYIYKRIKDD